MIIAPFTVPFMLIRMPLPNQSLTVLTLLPMQLSSLTSRSSSTSGGHGHIIEVHFTTSSDERGIPDTAYKSLQYLPSSLKHDSIKPEPSEELDRVYEEEAARSVSSRISAPSSDSESPSSTSSSSSTSSIIITNFIKFRFFLIDNSLTITCTHLLKRAAVPSTLSLFYPYHAESKTGSTVSAAWRAGGSSYDVISCRVHITIWQLAKEELEGEAEEESTNKLSGEDETGSCLIVTDVAGAGAEVATVVVGGVAVERGEGEAESVGMPFARTAAGAAALALAVKWWQKWSWQS
ncbi:hypothetical protein D9613_007248 [Agrocybe pediades]|uniref:Uncharacterized protein n=1 Tax=Agrocybe pediades TaxID=84607 RepID=A0A8H4QHY3_9AGAR|nr:hypothetical protein D9613_007248 [Agrocybe pediades]